MPTYDYDCKDCGPFEAFRPMSQRDAPAECPACSKSAQRTVGSSHVRLAGDTRYDDAATLAAAQGAYRRMRHAAGCGCC
jgi:putative FmdB family regulatory protein